jgi:hypothetical protein
VSQVAADIIFGSLDEIERTINQSDDPDRLESARKLLRTFLFKQSNSPEHGSLGDALAILAHNPTQYPVAAAVILRFLAESGVVPASNAANQIERSVVSLALGSLPELSDYLGVNPTAQTFQNFILLRGTHERICGTLVRLEKGPSSLELFLATRHPIIQALNHSAVRSYAAPFGLNRVLVAVEQIFLAMRKVRTSDQNTLHHQITDLLDLLNKYRDASK